MASIFFSTLLYLIPMVTIVFFIVSLCNFIVARNQYKTKPSELNEQKKNTAKTLLIVSSVIMGVLLAIVIGLLSLMFMAVAYM